MTQTATKGAGCVWLLALAMNFFCAAGSASAAADTSRYGAWGLACEKQKPKVCVLSQIVARDPQGKQVVVGANAYLDAETGKPKIEFRLSPLAVPSAGLGLKIDKGAEYRLAMSSCDPKLCVARGLLEGELRTRLESGTVAQLAFLLQDGSQVVVPLALKGLKSGMTALAARRPARAD
ncbi:MAG: invasion associated locus B family protein [Rhodocyclaceae bacterium]|nr:invasion associated locus B family protein [Rhodocyclaceae bacterium]